MNEQRGGPFGLIFRRPRLCLAMAGSFLVVISLGNLAIVRFVDTGSKWFHPGLYGWPSIASIPLPIIMLSGIFGLATGMAMLIAAAYLSGRRTKSRLIGCALVSIGVMTIAVGLYDQGAGWMLGILLMGTGVVILRRFAESSVTPDSG